MCLGEKAELTISAEHGYGAVGAPPLIPPNATLCFTIELLKIRNRPPTKWLTTDVELLEIAVGLKDDGTKWFKAGDYPAASSCYEEAISNLETINGQQGEVKNLTKTILQNLCVISNKLADYRSTIQNCTKALKIDENAVKALYLRSVAYEKVQAYDDATEDVKNAIRFQPQEKYLRDHFELVKKSKAAKAQGQKLAMQKFLAQGVYQEKEGLKTKKVHQTLPVWNPKNTQVFFTIAIGSEGTEGY